MEISADWWLESCSARLVGPVLIVSDRLRTALLALTAYGSHYSPRDSPANKVGTLNGYVMRAGEFIARVALVMRAA